MSTHRSIIFSSLLVAFLLAICPPVALGQTMSISTVGDRTGTITLFKQQRKEFKKFGLAEIKGRVLMGASGILEGAESFLRLQTTAEPNKWVKITKRDLVQGRLIVTTEADKTYTIYDVQGDYVAKIALGTFLEKDSSEKK